MKRIAATIWIISCISVILTVVTLENNWILSSFTKVVAYTPDSQSFMIDRFPRSGSGTHAKCIALNFQSGSSIRFRRASSKKKCELVKADSVHHVSLVWHTGSEGRRGGGGRLGRSPNLMVHITLGVFSVRSERIPQTSWEKKGRNDFYGT